MIKKQSNCLGDKILCRVALGLEVSILDSHLNWNLPLTWCRLPAVKQGRQLTWSRACRPYFHRQKGTGRGRKHQAVVRLLAVRFSLSPKRRRYDQGGGG
jgi:hypothetical protein